MATAPYTARVGADGTATITIKTGARRRWTVGQISVEMVATPSGAVCNIRKNTYLVTPMIPGADVAASLPYIDLNDTDTLTIKWEGCTPNAIGKALVLYEDVS